MATVSSCRNELRSIISELRDIEYGIRKDFRGIGEAQCADCLERVAKKYDGVLNRLNRVNPKRLADWKIAKGG